MNRKLLWVPSNVVVTVALVAGVWAAWPSAPARSAAIAALVLFFAIHAMTILYFAPAVLRVERDGVAPNAPASRRWVMLSRVRTPLALGVVICLVASVVLLARSA